MASLPTKPFTMFSAISLGCRRKSFVSNFLKKVIKFPLCRKNVERLNGWKDSIMKAL
jgi:hypothetical protein